MNVTFRRNITIKDTQQVISAGVKAKASFIKLYPASTPTVPVDAIEVTIAEGTELSPGVIADKNIVVKTRKFSVFFKTPSVNTLERWSFDGVAKSVTGKRCEPDGHGDDGSPSWLLVLGMI
jgi:hypothetical protein